MGSNRLILHHKHSPWLNLWGIGSAMNCLQKEGLCYVNNDLLDRQVGVELFSSFHSLLNLSDNILI